MMFEHFRVKTRDPCAKYTATSSEASRATDPGCRGRSAARRVYKNAESHQRPAGLPFAAIKKSVGYSGALETTATKLSELDRLCPSLTPGNGDDENKPIVAKAGPSLKLEITFLAPFP